MFFDALKRDYSRALLCRQAAVLQTSAPDKRISLCLKQGWANFLYGGPHLKKMLQPRAAHSHYKIGRFTLRVKKHIFILNTVFFISHSGALGRRAPRLRTLHPMMVSMSGGGLERRLFLILTVLNLFYLCILTSLTFFFSFSLCRFWLYNILFFDRFHYVIGLRPFFFFGLRHFLSDRSV